jgi:hypothetical protein
MVQQAVAAIVTIWKTIVVESTSTPADLIAKIGAKGRQVTGWAKDIVSKPEFLTSIIPGTYKLVVIRGDEFPTDAERTTANIYKEAAKRKYRKPPAFLAAVAREQFSQDELGAPWVVFMHEPILDSRQRPRVLALHQDACGEYLHAFNADPEGQWYREFVFVFLAPQES